MAEEIDFSKAVEQVKAMLSSEEGENTIQGILGMLSGGQGASEETPAAESNEPSPQPENNSSSELLSGLGDIETIMKIKNVLGAMGSQKNDSSIAFLHAIKPFLSTERQTKLDSAAKILNMTKAVKALKNAGFGGV